MRRLQLDLNASMGEQANMNTLLYHAARQGFTLKETTLRGIALEIRDDIGLKRCTRVLDTFIFTDI